MDRDRVCLGSTTPVPVAPSADYAAKNTARIWILSWLSRKVDESGMGPYNPVVARVELRCAEDALSEQIEVRPTVHLPFDELESIHLALRLTVAPRHRQPCAHRCLVG